MYVNVGNNNPTFIKSNVIYNKKYNKKIVYNTISTTLIVFLCEQKLYVGNSLAGNPTQSDLVCLRNLSAFGRG